MLGDFQAHYNLDFVALLRTDSGYSPRRILALIRQLPIESATQARLRGGEHFAGWGLDQYFLAALVNAVRENTYAVIAANSKRKPKPPEPVETPDQQQRKQQPQTNRFAAMAGARIAATRKAKGD